MVRLQSFATLAGRVFLFLLLTTVPTLAQLDLSQAKLYLSAPEGPLPARARQVLVEEVSARTGLTFRSVSKVSAKGDNLVILALEENVSSLPKPFQAQYAALPEIRKDGFKLFANRELKTVVIVGKDARGLLYGVGRFLRKAELSGGKVIFPDAGFALATSPAYPIRGHQLGYRPKTNSYDAFTVAQFDQYIRELALFGANSIEILPPNTDDDATSRHMKVPALEMVKEQSRISQSYGLDVWMWYPNLEKNYSDPETIRKGLAEREEVFRSVSKLNALFAPGGDPGDLEPDELFKWMGQVAVALQKYHPEAKIWISPQSFRPDKPWFDAFFDHVNKGYPWLGGIVFGPWVKVPIEEIRARVKPGIPIRNYPDITHSLACQYPVPDWDKAWAVTLGREAVNPRPYDQKHFHNAVAPYCTGSISYSEGTNDDLNKFIWSDQDWDPKTDVTETLMDYSRLFFGPQFAYRGAEGLKGLEENSRGNLLGKVTVAQTFRQWQAMEKEADNRTLAQARFQMGLIRAYFDHYTAERLVYETELQRRAIEKLEGATRGDVDRAVTEAAAILESAWKSPVRPELRKRCFDLADSLYRSIGAQLTVSKHGAMPGRGNFIDNIQFPLNDAPWLLAQLERISALSQAEAKLKEIRLLTARTDPGPGGFYDHLASPESRHRIVANASWAEDPGSLRSPRTGFGLSLPGTEWYKTIPEIGARVPLVPANWNNQIEVLYDNPLKVRYDNLEKNARYRMRVVYTGRFKSHIKLVGDGGVRIHDAIKVGEQPVYEFDIPAEVTRDGKAEFTWTCETAERGVQVAEIWLLKTN
ncbi:hypothetical protein GCM10023091_19960 [Ravibacter arvi]|uniref:Alpha glucuronidase N-terminal domain-containing protein n=1 Tax=Ravibacter arvi TaxID=2051041 RepID=A0ABP8LYF2_9BACT